MQPNLPVLAIHDGRPMADSREIASTFDRLHKDVLKAYRNLECSEDFRQRNFAPFKIKDLTGESLSHVLMSRDGFTLLVFGFTGAAAVAFKEGYLARFNAMEAELQRQASPALPQSLPEALRLAADLAEANAKQAAEIAALAPRSRALAVISDSDGTFCIRDCAKMLGMPEKDLRAFLRSDGWIYRRDSLSPWCARAERLSQGWMVTKAVAIETGHGKPWQRPQARITCAGLVVLAKRLGKPVPPEAQQSLSLTIPTERSA